MAFKSSVPYEAKHRKSEQGQSPIPVTTSRFSPTRSMPNHCVSITNNDEAVLHTY